MPAPLHPTRYVLAIEDPALLLSDRSRHEPPVAGLFLVAQIFLDFMPNPAAKTCADCRSDWTADRGADDAPYSAADSCSNELGLLAFLFVRHDAPLYVA